MNYTATSLDAERSVLGAILIEPNVIDEVITMLEARDFTTQAHQILYATMKNLHSKDKAIDLVTVTQELQNSKQLAEVGGVSYMTEIAQIVPYVANVKHYADDVRKQAVRRRAASMSDKIRHLAIEKEFDDEEDLFQEIEKMTDAIRPDTSGDLVSIANARDEYFDYLAREDDLIKTGFSHFDNWMGGIGRGWLYVLAARPSVGKTAKMLQMLRGIAEQDKGQCLVWSQEMKRPQLFNRMLASYTGISANKFRRKQLTPRELDEIRDGYDYLSMMDIQIADAKAVTIEEVRAVARQAKRRKGPISAIFIDYLGIMNIPQPPGMTRAQAIGEVTKNAKRMANELDCAVILLAQMNREGTRALKPSLEHLKESGDIEQDADVVEFLWENPEDSTVNDGKYVGARVVQSYIAKGRDIGINDFRYAFKTWTQEFIPLD
jgi:replicative DNA helicase